MQIIGFLGGLDPELLLERGGLLLLAAIVFAESGLFVGFFLPGDSLLFAAGVATGVTDGVLPSLPIVIATVIAAAVAGDQVGYLFGRKVGVALARRPSTRWFRHEHLERAELFVDRHGPKAIVLARFIPIVRTFAPIVAGVGRMRYRTFVSFNVVGGVLWGGGVVTLGHLLGNVALVRDNLELAILAVVAVSFIPVIVEHQLQRRRSRAESTEPVEPPTRSST